MVAISWQRRLINLTLHHRSHQSNERSRLENYFNIILFTLNDFGANHDRPAPVLGRIIYNMSTNILYERKECCLNGHCLFRSVSICGQMWHIQHSCEDRAVSMPKRMHVKHTLNPKWIPWLKFRIYYSINSIQLKLICLYLFELRIINNMLLFILV